LRDAAETLRSRRVNVGLVVFMVFSAAVGVLAGYKSTWTLQSFFRLLVLSNLALVGYMVLVRNVVAGILIYVYSLVFLNYYWRVVIPGLWPDLDIPRLMFVFVWLVFLMENLVGSRRMLPNTVIGALMLMVLGAFMLSMALAGKTLIRQFLNGYAIPYAMFMISKNVFIDKRTVDKFVFWLAVPLAFYFPMTAILEHYKVTALLFPHYIGKAVVGEVDVNWGGRAMGTFIQPAVTGYAMTAMYVLALYSLGRIRRPLARIYTLFLSVITPVGIFFTYTRSVFLGYVLAILLLLGFSRRQRVLSLVLVVAMALAVIGNWSGVTSAEREAGGVGEVSTAQARLVLAKVSIRMFMDKPFLGVGFGNFVNKAKPYVGQVHTTFLGYREAWIGAYTGQHNQFLSVLTEIGLVGFVPLLLLYVFLATALIRARGKKTANYDSELLVSVWAILAAYIAEVLFVEPRFFEFMNMFPFMFAGIIIGGYQRATLRPGAATRGDDNMLRKEYAT
jgi:hypothetical protein